MPVTIAIRNMPASLRRRLKLHAKLEHLPAMAPSVLPARAVRAERDRR